VGSVPIDRRSDVPIRFEFAVPRDIDIAEPSEGAATEAEENVRLGALRRALDVDSRWQHHRVASLWRPENAQWHLVVWVAPGSNDEEDVADTREGVPELVGMIVPGAHVISVTRTDG
jgi:hypothetical protein